MVLEGAEVVAVDGDAGPLHLGQQVDQRQLDLGEQPGAAALLELVVERRGQVEHRAGVQHLGLAGAGAAGPDVTVETLQAELPVVGRPLPQLALEVADGQVGQVVGALVGPGEVRRQRGVALQAGQRHPARREGEHRPLGVVEHLGLGRRP